jgi:hypothetical protein
VLPAAAAAAAASLQVANYLEFSAEDGEAERKKAIGEVVELGQEVWVKVRQRWRMPVVLCLFGVFSHLGVASSLLAHIWWGLFTLATPVNARVVHAWMRRVWYGER